MNSVDMAELFNLRENIEYSFSPETSYPGSFRLECPSAGHCVVIALLVYQIYGGELVSAIVNGVSHWYNRIDDYELDLTGDQFGFDRVRFAAGYSLYSGSKVRSLAEVDQSTLERYRKFMRKLLTTKRLVNVIKT